MQRMLGRIGISVLIVVGSLGGARNATAQEDTLVVVAPGLLGGPRTDGSTIIWTDRRGGGPEDTGVYAVGLADRLVTPVATGPGSQTASSIAGGIVVWTETKPGQPAGGSDIRGKDLASGREFTVAATEADENSPLVQGSRVVWQQWQGGAVVFLERDIRAMSPPKALVRLVGAIGPTTDGARVLWRELTALPQGDQGWRLRALTFATGEAVTVAEGGGSGPAAAGPAVYAIRGDLVLYGGDAQYAVQGLTLVNLASGERRGLAEGGVTAVTTDGRYVFWAGSEGAITSQGGRETNLTGYDVATDSTFPIPMGGAGTAPFIAGGVLTWVREGAGGQEIHAARIADMLPSARRTDPGPPTPERRSFPETGHALTFGFKSYWEANGGLPVFGYPLTIEFTRVAPADVDHRHTIQYTERQRFEYHPELAGTPYEVSLGRLGAEDAARRADLRGLWAFNPIEGDADHPAGCRYLPEARHRLCGEFGPYWEGRGLDLGDAGVSFRESLALFGSPLSEEFIDPESGLITQYFERAVFEYHPDLPPGQRVLLKRLGAERLAAFGW